MTMSSANFETPGMTLLFSNTKDDASTPGQGTSYSGRVSERERKDRLIQTRVPESLESALKDEATRRRLPVSQLVRNILEDTLQIVGDVVDGVDAIVQDSIKLGRNVARSRAGAAPAPVATPAPAGPPVAREDDLSDVYAWNEVVLHRPANCSRCGAGLDAGSSAFAGLRDDPSRGRAWSCPPCVTELGPGD
jgi:hypothetical protein